MLLCGVVIPSPSPHINVCILLHHSSIHVHLEAQFHSLTDQYATQRDKMEKQIDEQQHRNKRRRKIKSYILNKYFKNIIQIVQDQCASSKEESAKKCIEQHSENPIKTHNRI